MKTVAVFGSGFIGNVHAEAIQKSGALKLAAFVQREGEKSRAASEKFKVPCFAGAEEMLEKINPDILDICLPSASHEEFVLFAAKHKKHVICEKPFSLSSESCERMIKACAGAGVHFMVAQVLRWFPEYVKIRELLPKLGPLHAVSCYRLAQHPNWTTWHRDPKISGGGLFDLLLHETDYLYSLFGAVDHVYAAGWKSPTGCWNHVLSTLAFKNGVKVQAEGCSEMTGNYPFSAGFRAVGDEGALEYKLSAGFNIENLGAASNRLTFFGKGADPAEVAWDAGDAFLLELEAFARSVETGKPVPIAPEDSLYVIKITEAIQRSLETGGTERIQ
ncbi:MAG: Gfo/Idh/MocA family oxidoreductase [Treponema sp.]|nr:Gfo/Idh/MocA family oxidoreductase [Treponema sp.]